MAGKIGGAAIYNVEVAPGTYRVAAKTGSSVGYYDGYMKDDTFKTRTVNVCDAEYHTPLTVSVASGQEITGIAAGNFKYASQNC